MGIMVLNEDWTDGIKPKAADDYGNYLMNGGKKI